LVVKEGLRRRVNRGHSRGGAGRARGRERRPVVVLDWRKKSTAIIRWAQGLGETLCAFSAARANQRRPRVR